MTTLSPFVKPCVLFLMFVNFSLVNAGVGRGLGRGRGVLKTLPDYSDAGSQYSGKSWSDTSSQRSAQSSAQTSVMTNYRQVSPDENSKCYSNLSLVGNYLVLIIILIINKQIFLNDFYSDIETWCSSFYYICHELDFVDNYNNLQPIDLGSFKAKLEIFAQEKWLETVQSKPKLRTYKIFKSRLVPEDYVVRLMSRFQRSTFAKFRCGILPLNLEIGRYRGIKVENRICPLCKNGVETEIHFLLECDTYDRGDFLDNNDVNSDTLTNDEKLKVLMEHHQKATSKFVCKLWNQRQAQIIV